MVKSDSATHDREPTGGAPAAAPRKPYLRPALQSYGTLVDVTSAQIVFEAKAATGSQTTHTVPIPANPAFLGRVGFFQGGTFTGGVAQLCNGLMGTIGF